ncbi:hypothetical protein PoB_004561100 [Plakobranchus ocellatus]|uniref:Uncharacterized protein n=1 Tax=Plakobranchus ocellatus TaxID=259542 RepID=A0AAV4B6W8_9GAST|nr:hypothetical protein PoB_004561100 [Plakobranchus ocellatus]
MRHSAAETSPVHNKVISGFQALRQARALVVGLEPATEGFLQISGPLKAVENPKFFTNPPVWGTRNFTTCSKRPGTSLGRSSGESPRLGRCVQVEKTKRLDWCAAIAGALPPQPQGRCGLGLRQPSVNQTALRRALKVNAGSILPNAKH